MIVMFDENHIFWFIVFEVNFKKSWTLAMIVGYKSKLMPPLVDGVSESGDKNMIEC